MFRFIHLMPIALAAGCSYNAPAKVSPSFNVYSNYGEKIPGRYALYVDNDKMFGTFKVSGFACSAHNYPLDARSAFSVSVQKTLEQLFDSIEVVPTKLDRTGIGAGGFDGFILVEADDLDIDLKVIPNFFTATMEADAEIVANYSVDGANGRVVGGSVEGDEDYTTDSGAACEGGAQAIGGAVEEAMKDLSKQLGERLSNAPRLREQTAPSS